MAYWYQTTEGRPSCGMDPSSSSEASSRTKKLGSHSLLRGPDHTPTPKSILCFQKDAVATAHSYPICIELGCGGNRTLRSHACPCTRTDAQDQVDKHSQRKRIWPDAKNLARCLLRRKVGGDCRCGHSSNTQWRGHMDGEDFLRNHNW